MSTVRNQRLRASRARPELRSTLVCLSMTDDNKVRLEKRRLQQQRRRKRQQTAAQADAIAPGPAAAAGSDEQGTHEEQVVPKYPPYTWACCNLCGSYTFKFYRCNACAASGIDFDVCSNCYTSGRREPCCTTALVPAEHCWSHHMTLFDAATMSSSGTSFVPALNACVNVPMNASNDEVVAAEAAAGPACLFSRRTPLC